jgi:hypothetical protein
LHPWAELSFVEATIRGGADMHRACGASDCIDRSCGRVENVGLRRVAAAVLQCLRHLHV